jgi:phenol hydroxylase P4 protein
MSVAAVKPYEAAPMDGVEKFHGAQLLNIGWDDHLLFCSPYCLPFPPAMVFRDIFEKVLPDIYGVHPDWSRIDWSTVRWFKSGRPFKPDYDRSLADNGLGHKDAIRFSAPGLKGLKGSSS